jgi:hypothetical protein
VIRFAVGVPWENPVQRPSNGLKEARQRAIFSYLEGFPGLPKYGIERRRQLFPVVTFMIGRFGNLFYYVVGAVAVCAAISYLNTDAPAGGDPPALVLGVLAAIFAAGWGVRYVLTGKKTLR